MNRENDIILGLTIVERHDLICYFLSKEISLADTESTGLNNKVLSESTESLDNVQLTICTHVL